MRRSGMEDGSGVLFSPHEMARNPSVTGQAGQRRSEARARNAAADYRRAESSRRASEAEGREVCCRKHETSETVAPKDLVIILTRAFSTSVEPSTRRSR